MGYNIRGNKSIPWNFFPKLLLYTLNIVLVLFKKELYLKVYKLYYGGSMLEEYNRLKSTNDDQIVFIKRGYFYYTYFRDSYIMNYIFHYKKANSKVSFPITNKVYVCNELDKLNIGYVIDNETTYGDSEVYSSYLILSYNKTRCNILIKEITSILINYDVDTLTKIKNNL